MNDKIPSIQLEGTLDSVATRFDSVLQWSDDGSLTTVKVHKLLNMQHWQTHADVLETVLWQMAGLIKEGSHIDKKVFHYFQESLDFARERLRAEKDG